MASLRSVICSGHAERGLLASRWSRDNVDRKRLLSVKAVLDKNVERNMLDPLPPANKKELLM
ncbi:MAG: hypothetical protein AAF194_03050, partial [Pseudomonadota bacterium]